MANRALACMVVCMLIVTFSGVQAENLYGKASQSVACVISDSKQGQSIGTAFFVTPTVLATARHQVSGSTRTTVRLVNGQEVPGKILGMDPAHDIALIEIKQSGPATLPLDPSLPALGEPVFTIGCPLGFSHTLTRGVISRQVTVLNGKAFIQADLAIHLGNSGGPLINQRGAVIGVVHGHVKKINGINFAVPSRHLQELMKRMRLVNPALTVPMTSTNAPLAERATKADNLQQKILQSPWIAEHYYNLGLYRLEQGNHEEALELFEQAMLRRSPYPEALNNYGITLHLLGRQAEGRDALLRVISQAPGYGLAYFNLGVIYASGLADVRSAQASFKRFLELSPNSPLANSARQWLNRTFP